MTNQKPLEGLKVVELGMQVAAPSACRILADWGADVIKLEGVDKGDSFRDWTRGMSMPVEEDFDPCFDNLNANKRAVSINSYKNPEGQGIAQRLLSNADVFITNLREGALKGNGLDWDTLKEINPRLVMAQLNGYGAKGAEANRPGYDTTCFWPRSGFLYSQAFVGDYPVYIPMGTGDLICAMSIIASVMAALESRRSTGKGDHVVQSLYNTAIWGLSIPIVGSQWGLQFPVDRSTASPFGIMCKCKDGQWFMPQVVNFARDHQTYYHILGLDDLIGDPIFENRPEITKQGKIPYLIKRVEEGFLQHTSDEWVQIFNENNLAGEKLYSYGDVRDDPQALENEFVVEKDYGNGRKAKVVRSALRSKNSGLPEFKRGPMMGEDTEEILAEIGYSKEEIEDLENKGLVKQHE
jgi:crotonobetainyl-CoA:carnitine CoA-transferase CaiB-like acyl-CoA transferase